MSEQPNEPNEPNPRTARWQKIKSILKKGVSASLPYIFPVALSIITGGIATPLAVAPIVQLIKSKIEERRLNISDKIMDEVRGKISEKVQSFPDIVETLQVKLKEENPDVAPDEVQANADLIFRPIINDLKNGMDLLSVELKKGQIKPEDVNDLLRGWGTEFLNSMDIKLANQSQEFRGMLQTFISNQNEMIISQFNVQMQEFSQMQGMLTNIQEKLDLKLNQLGGTHLSSLSHQALLRFCEAMIQRGQFASRYDVPFNADQFVPNTNLDSNFLNFLSNSKEPTGANPPFFLVLAHLGMGKTWNAIHIALASIQSLDTPVFFFSLEQDLFRQLKFYFGSSDVETINKFCQDIGTKAGKQPIFILDGLDELPQMDLKTREIFGFVNSSIKYYPKAILFFMTCRLIDWNYHPAIIEQLPKISSFIYNSFDKANVKDVFLQSNVSFILDLFTNDQIEQAYQQYNLDPAKIEPELLDFCRIPFFLRILTDYLTSLPETPLKYPSPRNLPEFFPLFTDEKGSTNTMLGRMGIIGNTRRLLIQILRQFDDFSGKISLNKLQPMIQGQMMDWNRIVSSGLLKQTDYYGEIFVFIYPIYIRLLIEMKRIVDKIVGITAETPKPQPLTSKSPGPPIQKFAFSTKSSDAQSNSLLSDAIDSLSNETLLAFAEKCGEIRRLSVINPSQSGYFVENKKVIWLNLANRGLTSLPDSIGNLVNLQYLDLHGNRLTQIPRSIRNFTNLRILNLDENQITEIPETIGYLVNLESFTLDMNHLEQIPSSIINLRNLKILCICGNVLSKLPMLLGNLKNLKELKLFNNALVELPESMGGLENLELLDLRVNKIMTLPDSLDNLPRLRKFDISGNPISMSKTFKIFKKLKSNGCEINK